MAACSPYQRGWALLVGAANPLAEAKTAELCSRSSAASYVGSRPAWQRSRTLAVISSSRFKVRVQAERAPARSNLDPSAAPGGTGSGPPCPPGVASLRRRRPRCPPAPVPTDLFGDLFMSSCVLIAYSPKSRIAKYSPTTAPKPRRGERSVLSVTCGARLTRSHFACMMPERSRKDVSYTDTSQRARSRLARAPRPGTPEPAVNAEGDHLDSRGGDR